MNDIERIFGALADAQVRYLVVGGVAVVLHGHLRFTADLDLVVWLEEQNVKSALSALAQLGYRSRLPVPMEQFADNTARERWTTEKNLVAFTLWSSQFPGTEIDLFAREPFPFEVAYARAPTVELGATHLKVASIDDLIELKRTAGRPKDLEDIAALEAISKQSKGEA